MPNVEEIKEEPSVASSGKGASEQQVNLEAIMHVPLDVSVELGRIQLPLHVVARLHRGMVVDLKKEANAEVDILANGRVFARGEVVSADGNLGVRVVEVVPQGDRIQSLS